VSIEEVLLDELKDVVTLVIEVIANKQIPPGKVRAMIEAEITRLADEEMKNEFPKG
jgi:hypothetical protein